MTEIKLDAKAMEVVTLEDCPPGLFRFGDCLGFKTEYRAMETVGPINIPGDQVRWKVGNQPDAYVVASGEYFWGEAKTHDERAALMVAPVAALPDPAPAERGAVEAKTCRSCKGTGTEADYVGDDMRCVEVECSTCGGSGLATPPAPAAGVTEAVVDAGLECYSEGGCMGLNSHERREVVRDILEAALRAQEAHRPEPVIGKEAGGAVEGWRKQKLTEAMIWGAAEAHYGKRRVAQNGGPEGITMTVDGADWTFTKAFRRMWRGALAAAPLTFGGQAALRHGEPDAEGWQPVAKELIRCMDKVWENGERHGERVWNPKSPLADSLEALRALLTPTGGQTDGE